MKIVKAQVKLYEGKSGGYPIYTVCYYRHGKRIRENFRKLAKAKSRLHEISLGIERGRQAVMSLTHADWESYVHAKDLLKPLGIPLHAAIEQFLVTREQQEKQPFTAKRAGEIVEQLLVQKMRDGMSSRYVKSLRSHLRRFAAAFHVDISSITAGMIEDWLEKFNVGPRTRNNIRNSLVTLFQYARAHGYLPKHQRTEAEDVPRAKERGGEIGILKPKELAELLSKARDSESTLFLAIGAFSGIRTAEMIRLSFEDINFERSHIIVGKDKSKTATRRLVPIQPNLMQWLAPYRGMTGRVFVSEHAADRVIAFAKQYVNWPNNALRHSYASYRLAATQDAAKTALELGNSPTMLFSNYRELADEHEARAWFSVAPKRSKNILYMAG